MFSFFKKTPEPINPNPLNQPTIPVQRNGWIFCKDAQPDFDQLILVLLYDADEQRYAVGVGKRTQDLIENSAQQPQEKWDVYTTFKKANSGGIVAWQYCPRPEL